MKWAKKFEAISLEESSKWILKLPPRNFTFGKGLKFPRNKGEDVGSVDDVLKRGSFMICGGHMIFKI